MGRVSSKSLSSNFRAIPIEGLLGIATATIAISLSLHLSIFGLGTLFLTSILGIALLLDVGFSDWRWQRQLRQLALRHGGLTVLLVLGLAVLVFDYASLPVHAQFMQQGEAWMTGAFPGVGAELIALVFNVLRGLFLLYVGIALVKIINAAREDEDWKSLARTPLIIVIAVVSADLLVGLIVGGGGP